MCMLIEQQGMSSTGCIALCLPHGRIAIYQTWMQTCMHADIKGCTSAVFCYPVARLTRGISLPADSAQLPSSALSRSASLIHGAPAIGAAADPGAAAARHNGARSREREREQARTGGGGSCWEATISPPVLAACPLSSPALSSRPLPCHCLPAAPS